MVQSWHGMVKNPLDSNKAAKANENIFQKHLARWGIIFTQTWLRYVRVFAVTDPSVCNVGASYSDGWSFRQNFFTAVYPGHPLTSVQNFTEIVPRGTL